MKTKVILLAGLFCQTILSAQSWFLVGGLKESKDKDSYVVSLSKAEDIAEARRQLTLPLQDRDFIVQYITKQGDGINRDHLSITAPLWSWHVSEFIKFRSKDTATVVDGSPTFVERRPDLVFSYTNTVVISFTDYGIINELTSPKPLSLNVSSEGCFATFSWAPLPKPVGYTVESKSLTGGIWTALPGVAWPTMNEQARVPVDQLKSGDVIRVKATESN